MGSDLTAASCKRTKSGARGCHPDNAGDCECMRGDKVSLDRGGKVAPFEMVARNYYGYIAMKCHHL
jgi:hypothetical protein